jgi:trigger factor
MADDQDTREDEGAETAVSEQEAYKLSLDVQVEDAGPCRKHVRVRVPRNDIEHFFEESLGELSESAAVPGFRQGHAPKELVQKRFRKELGGQVKQRVLLQSLEQLQEETKLDPINEPDIDVESLEIPEEGDFEYEFDVEVRPDFELPDYKGLKVKRPTRETTDADVEAYLARFLEQYGDPEPHDGPAEPGDSVIADVEFRHNDRQLRKLHHVTLRLRPVLRFQDAEISGFDERMKGAGPGDTRESETTISQEAESLEMRGEKVQVRITVDEVRRMRMPEMTKEFFDRVGVESEQELRDEVREILERQVKFQQRQAVRAQVLEKITESANWDLPEQLVRRQTENALRREILEMQQAGFTTREIQARENQIRQQALTTTRQALKEHFVLDKIATQENIETEPTDVDTEIAYMAMQRGESPRRVRARLVKSGMIDNLEAQIRERKAVDHILEHAQFEDVPMDPLTEDRVEAVPYSVLASVTPAPAVEEEDEE